MKINVIRQLALSDIQVNKITGNNDFYLNGNNEPLPWEEEAYYKSLKEMEEQYEK